MTTYFYESYLFDYESYCFLMNFVDIVMKCIVINKFIMNCIDMFDKFYKFLWFFNKF